MIGAFAHSPMAGLVELRRIDVSAPGVVVATTSQGGRSLLRSTSGAAIATLARDLRPGDSKIK